MSFDAGTKNVPKPLVQKPAKLRQVSIHVSLSHDVEALICGDAFVACEIAIFGGSSISDELC
jgi:hypothetical protein